MMANNKNNNVKVCHWRNYPYSNCRQVIQSQFNTIYVYTADKLCLHSNVSGVTWVLLITMSYVQMWNCNFNHLVALLCIGIYEHSRCCLSYLTPVARSSAFQWRWPWNYVIVRKLLIGVLKKTNSHLSQLWSDTSSLFL